VIVAEADGGVRGFASAAAVTFFHDGTRRLRLTAIAVSPPTAVAASHGAWSGNSSGGDATGAAACWR